MKDSHDRPALPPLPRCRPRARGVVLVRRRRPHAVVLRAVRERVDGVPMTREEKRERIRMRCTECEWTDTAMRYWDGKRLSHF